MSIAPGYGTKDQIIEQLRDENERLRKQLEDRRHTNAGWNAYYAQEKEVERLHKIEAVAKDLTRYHYAGPESLWRELEEALK